MLGFLKYLTCHWASSCQSNGALVHVTRRLIPQSLHSFFWWNSNSGSVSSTWHAEGFVKTPSSKQEEKTLTKLWQLWRLSEEFSRCSSGSCSFQESLNFLHNSQCTQPAVISFLVHSFHFLPLWNPILWWLFEVCWFVKIKVQSAGKCYFSNVKYNIRDFCVAITHT